MLINADFSCRAALKTEEHEWIKSPQNGVERVMLDRVGFEEARATSLVRYAPSSYFPQHQHPGGEEILVLSGTFSADNKHYPTGWYLRNPPASSHTPYSDEGAIIFVKLRQMLPSEERHVAIDTHDIANWQPVGNREVCSLFSGDSEQVSLQRLKVGDALFTEDLMSQTVAGGAELLVVKGTLIEGDERYKQGSWIRWPVGAQPQIKAGKTGATIYLKTGHLAHIIGATANDSEI